MAVTAAGKNRIMIFGPKTDGIYLVSLGPKAASGSAKRRCKPFLGATKQKMIGARSTNLPFSDRVQLIQSYS